MTPQDALLLERGADPCDAQVCYNVTQGQGANPCCWPALLYAHSLKTSRQGEIEDQQMQRPLHVAAGHEAFRVAQLLIDRGAEMDPRETNWDATPLGYAVYGQDRQMIELLSRYTRDVFELTLLGNVERLREALDAQPELAKARDKSGATPLFWVRDEETAVEMIERLLIHGADSTVRLKDGETAADQLRRQGLEETANALRGRGIMRE